MKQAKKRNRYVLRFPSGCTSVVTGSQDGFRNYGVIMPPFETDITFHGPRGFEEYKGVKMPHMMLVYNPLASKGKKTFQLFAVEEGRGVHPFTGGNVYPSGDICWGNNHLPKDPRGAWIAFWESSFNSDLVTISDHVIPTIDRFVLEEKLREGMRVPMPFPNADVVFTHLHEIPADHPARSYTGAYFHIIRALERWGESRVLESLVSYERSIRWRSLLTRMLDNAIKTHQSRRHMAGAEEDIAMMARRLARRARTADEGDRRFEVVTEHYTTNLFNNTRYWYAKTNRLRRALDAYNESGFLYKKERSSFDSRQLLNWISICSQQWENYYHSRYNQEWVLGHNDSKRNKLKHWVARHHGTYTNKDYLRAKVERLLQCDTNNSPHFKDPEVTQDWLRLRKKLSGAIRVFMREDCLTVRVGASRMTRRNHRPSLMAWIHGLFATRARREHLKSLWSESKWREMCDWFPLDHALGKDMEELPGSPAGLLVIPRGTNNIGPEILGLRDLIASIQSTSKLNLKRVEMSNCPECGYDEYDQFEDYEFTNEWGEQEIGTRNVCCECGHDFHPWRSPEDLEINMPYYENDGQMIAVLGERIFRGVLMKGASEHRYPVYLWGELTGGPEEKESTSEDS